MQTDLLQQLALLVMAIGFIGAVIPVLPGAPLIWAGAFVWAWADGFKRVGAPVLIALFILMLFTFISDWALGAFFTKKSGASWKTVVASVAGGIGGAIVLAEIPILGSILGATIGSVLAVVAAEYAAHRQWESAIRASKGFLLGCFVSQFVELALCALMVLIFAWQAFWK